jgi:MYXO-CTERM domain-containing protein
VAFVDPAAGRLHSLYLALALAAVGLALGWRRILPT